MSDPYNSPQSQPNAFPPPQQPHQAPPQTDGFAITSMVLGIIAVITCYFGAILGTIAVIFGHVSMGKIRRNPSTGGKGMAIAGLVCGYLSIAVTIVFVIFFFTAGKAIIDEAGKIEKRQKNENYENYFSE